MRMGWLTCGQRGHFPTIGAYGCGICKGVTPTEDEWHTYTCLNENVSGGKLARRPRPDMTFWEHNE